MSETPIYENFRDFLAAGWPYRGAIVDFMRDIGIEGADIREDMTPREIWGDLLSRYRQQLDEIVTIAQKAYPNREIVISRLASSYSPASIPQSPSINWRHNPYVGLRVIRDEQFFFGRKATTDQLLQLVLKTPLLTLYGGSGSGKSSLLYAGLIPQWKRLSGSTHKVITFTPDSDPFASLYGMGLGNNSDVKSLIDDAKDGKRPSLFRDIQSLLYKEAPLLVIVDQGEQLLHREETSANAKKKEKTPQEIFLECLFSDLGPKVHVIVAIRDDYFPVWRLKVSTAPTKDQFDLLPPNEEEFRQIVLMPARQQGVSFEPGLAEELVASLFKGDASLPLLQFLLQRLWDKDQPKDGVLNRDSYEKLGFVTGALTKHIQNFIDAHPGRETEIRRIFLSLVRFDQREGKYHAVSRPFLKSELPKDLVDALIDEKIRLVTTSERDGQM